MVPGLVQDIIYLTAVLNSCVNLIIYGMYSYTGTKRTGVNISQAPLMKSVLMSRPRPDAAKPPSPKPEPQRVIDKQ